MARRLLCEGWLEADADQDTKGWESTLVFDTPVAYCRQGEKVWFARGSDRSKAVCESAGASLTLVEDYDKLDLVERQLPDGSVARLPKDGVWMVEGPGQRSDVKNANKRIYSRKIWERIFGNPKSKQQDAIKQRGMVGHLEHPSDGKTDGKQAALVTVAATLQEDGTVWAKHELLNTPSGLILQELTRKNVRWGVSTRGAGSVDEGGRVHEEDYDMECWDGVMRPSVPGAYAKAGQLHHSGRKNEGLTDTTSRGECDEAAKALEETKRYRDMGVAARKSGKPRDPMRDPAMVRAEEALSPREWDAAVEDWQVGYDSEGRTHESDGQTGAAHDLVSRLARTIKREADLDKPGQTLSRESVRIRRAVASQLGLVAEALEDRQAQAIIESTTAGEGEGEGRETINEALAAMQKRLDAVVQENEAQRQENADLLQRVQVAEASRDESWQLVLSAEADLAKTAKALDAATALLADPREPRESDVVRMTQESLVAAIPGLEPFGNILAECRTAEQLVEALGELVPRVLAPKAEQRPRRTEQQAAPSVVEDASYSLPSGRPRQVSVKRLDEDAPVVKDGSGPAMAAALVARRS